MNIMDQKKFTFSTGNKTDIIDMTNEVLSYIRESGVNSGLCVVLVTHSTAGVALNSIGDPNTRRDLADEIDRIVPTRIDFHHQMDTPRDASAHVKLFLVGNSIALPIEDNNLPLSVSSGILLCEFDGPRTRTVTVQIWNGQFVV
jgi:secondary thiamine-phosphate synthase enzyme